MVSARAWLAILLHLMVCAVTTDANCVTPWIGDGWCDRQNNKESCDYDGGDCCSCLCVDGRYKCGIAGYDCSDPEAACDDDPCISDWLRDGWCDADNNIAECDYDGGDCCTCTCIDDNYSCGVNGFICTDPDANCDDDGTSCIDEWIGDGYCDDVNNNAECEYDGGDCCPCTCMDGYYSCGANGFSCADPDVNCDDDGSPCIEVWIGDGYCDNINNNADCDYDGGDCCSCTCIDSTYSCGDNGFNCTDPVADCDDDVSCINVWIGDGVCDDINNNDGCDFDGGDCCPCTCISNSTYSCGANGFSCVDPDANCDDDGDPCILEFIGDGYCDNINNNADCDYDGGDCCSCTCIDSTYSCGANGFSCADPDANCDDDGSPCIDEWIGDGYCDNINNNANCDYDGGDCCPCTCVDGEYTCGVVGFMCLEVECEDTPAPVMVAPAPAPAPDTPAPVPTAPVPDTPAPTASSACDPNPCENGGTCAIDVAGGHICTCASGYGGMSCQTDTTASGIEPFTIELQFEGNWTTARQAVFESAAQRWEEVVTHHPDCGASTTSPAGRLLITSELIQIDGVGGVLGQAGPTMVRSACLTISVEGEMSFDIADIADLEAQGLFEGTILHEIGHVIGFGSLWSPPDGACVNNCDTTAPSSPVYECPAALAVYNDLLGNPGGTEDEIIELDGGPGTACGHFDEDIFDNELMTGFINQVMSLSKLTAASLEDLDYIVDPSAVDQYTLPANLQAGVSSNANSTGNISLASNGTQTEIVVIDENDEVVDVIPGRMWTTAYVA